MNLLVGFVIVVCMAICEFDSQSSVEDVWTRVAAMFFMALSVPGLAVFQTQILTRRYGNSNFEPSQKEATLKRLSACHTAVWLVASLLIVGSVQWQTVVRSNWGLGRWPLIDEVLILLPIVLSLVASWAIFYDVQRTWINADSEPGDDRSSPGWQIVDPRRLAFVSVRFRVYFVMSLFPVAVIFLLRDVVAINESTPLITATAYLVAIAVVLLGFPLMLCLVWNAKPIGNRELAAELTRFCKDNRLRVAAIRVFETGNQISNAMVVGLVPWFRRIILTDGMVNTFPRRELTAILRHEAGHIRLFHMPIRIGFVLMPLVVLGTAELLGGLALDRLNSVFAELGIYGHPEWYFLSMLYIAYFLVTVSWLSKKMEFEADQFAVLDGVGFGDAYSNDVETRANELLDALMRFASYCPRQSDRETTMHPSLQRRISRIVQLRDDPGSRTTMRHDWRNRQLFWMAALMVICLAAVVI